MEFKLDTNLLARETIEKQRVSGIDVARMTLQQMIMACFRGEAYERLSAYTESAPAKELNWKKWVRKARKIVPTYLDVMMATEKNLQISTNFGMLLGAQQALLKLEFNNSQITGENWDAVSAATYKQALRITTKEGYPSELAEPHADTIAVQSARMWIHTGVYRTLQSHRLIPSSLSTMYIQGEMDVGTMKPIVAQIKAINKRVRELIERNH